MRAGTAGQVRVLSNTNALTEFLPETLSSFLAAHPHVSVDLEERLSDEIVGLIAEASPTSASWPARSMPGG